MCIIGTRDSMNYTHVATHTETQELKHVEGCRGDSGKITETGAVCRQ